MTRAYKKEINTYKKIQLNKYSSLIFVMLNCFFDIRKKNYLFYVHIIDLQQNRFSNRFIRWRTWFKR